MSSTSLIASISSLALLGKNYLVGSKYKIGDLVLDATTLEVIDYSNTITNHPISNGSNISDHIYSNPTIIKMDGLITNNSLYLSDISTLTGFFEGNVVSNIYNYITGPSKKQILAFNYLETLKENKTLVSIVSKMKTYDNMAIETLSFSTDKKTGDALEFSISLKQIKFVTSKTVTVTKPIISPSAPGVSNLASLGKGDTQKLNNEEKEKTKTNLKEKLDKLISF
jgi:hypothetical protein